MLGRESSAKRTIMENLVSPVVRAMVLSEDVLPGATATGNVHLINVFGAIRPQSDAPFPYRFPNLCVFLQLSDARGLASGRILGRSADSGNIVFASNEHPIYFRDRLQVKWVVFRLQDCYFPEAGVYWIEFYCDGSWMADQTVQLRGG
jgi:hypothetical protein